jgi:ribosomal subunit interface protein
MNFSFAGRHMDIGEALTNRAKEASALLADKYGTEFIDVGIVMKKDNHLFHCSISVKSNINLYHATNESNDPNVSFDGALHKIDLQLRKKKKPCRETCRANRVTITSFDNALPAEENAPMIIAEILDNLPFLSVSEAANQLRIRNARVFIFKNTLNESVNVVYRRDDGNIGWIDYTVKKE